MLKFSGYSWLIGGPIGLDLCHTVLLNKLKLQRAEYYVASALIDCLKFLWENKGKSSSGTFGLHLSAIIILRLQAAGSKRELFVGMNRHSNRHTSQGKCKVRSKFWWLTGFCNSHDVSHFAAFFIVVGAKTSIAESVGLIFLQIRRLVKISLVHMGFKVTLRIVWKW